MSNLSELNPAQQGAVSYKGGHVLIVAGPGTGKTHTLIHRIASTVPILKTDKHILAITFTNKAAEAMRDRLMIFDVPQRQIFVGTFHAFALKLLREFFEHTALPKNFKVASPEGLSGFEKAAIERISFIKSTKLAIQPDEEYKAYTRFLRQKGLIDFDDILRETLELLENEQIALQVKQRYPYIFVDEYQDINIVQNALLKTLVGTTGQITAIGDPNQSIYGFRGSDVKLFKRFEQDFPEATTLYLNENYRSSPNLLTASTQVISSQAQDVELIAKIYREGKLIIHQAATDRAEADFVAAQIEKMVGGMNMHNARGATRSFGDIVILYRLNAQRHVVMQALDHLGIPHQVSKKTAMPPEYSDEAALGQFEEIIDYNVEKVSLLTLHAAKGLEFPVVFIIGCEDKILPLDLEGMKGEAQEERRLFYVGMTRAKERLYLTYADRRQLYGKTAAFFPSPFLSDIQEDLKSFEAKRHFRKAKQPELADDGQMKLF